MNDPLQQWIDRRAEPEVPDDFTRSVLARLPAADAEPGPLAQRPWLRAALVLVAVAAFSWRAVSTLAPLIP